MDDEHEKKCVKIATNDLSFGSITITEVDLNRMSHRKKVLSIYTAGFRLFKASPGIYQKLDRVEFLISRNKSKP